MYGWMGKILRVNLTAGVCSEETLNPAMAKNYIGGRGLGIFYLSQEVEADVDPFSPQNPIIMATGPLTGTGAPTGARLYGDDQIAAERSNHLLKLRRHVSNRIQTHWI